MGFVYCLVAIEYSLIWNSCQLLNFAHTQLIMLGAYIFGGTFGLGLGASYLLGLSLIHICAPASAPPGQST